MACATSLGARTPATLQNLAVVYQWDGRTGEAVSILEQVREEADFELQEIDIGGDPGLEAQYREWLPVVEIDGERAFVYYVDSDAFRRKVAAQS